MAIAATGLSKTGVSTDIHVTYVSAAREGDVLEIEAWVTRVGKTMGFTMVEIRQVAVADEKGAAEGKGATVATGTHTKYLAGTSRGQEGHRS
jgi:acyl-coenzyme A thioesterase 13